MDELYFFRSVTAAVIFNETPLTSIYPRECPRQHEGTSLVFLLFLISCVLLAALGYKLILGRGAKIIEMAPNPNADFLERIGFSGEIPAELVCIITQCIMQDPVRIRDGHENHVFERTALEKWLNENRVNPLTRAPLSWWAALVSANDVSEKIKMWMGNLRLRRQVFSIWSREKIAGEKCKSDVTCLP